MERVRPNTSAEVTQQQTLHQQELRAKANGGWDSRKGESPQFKLPGGMPRTVSERGAILRAAMPEDLRNCLEQAMLHKNKHKPRNEIQRRALTMYRQYGYRAKKLEETGQKVTVENILHYSDQRATAASNYAHSQMTSDQQAALTDYWISRRSDQAQIPSRQRDAFHVYRSMISQYKPHDSKSLRSSDTTGSSSFSGTLTQEEYEWAWNQLSKTQQNAFERYIITEEKDMTLEEKEACGIFEEKVNHYRRNLQEASDDENE